jgi:hypothetical protein
MLKLIEAAANRRAGEVQLRQMNDRELADLGLGPSGIEFAVRTEADPQHTCPRPVLRRLAAVRRSNSHIRRRLTVD